MRYQICFALLAVAIAALGCGDEFMTTDMTSATNNQGYSLTVSAAPDNLNILGAGAITIVIEVLGPDGDGVDSAPVTLTSTLGTLAETELTTDADGFAITTLTSSSITGYAIVVGTYKGIQAMVKVEFWSGATQG